MLRQLPPTAVGILAPLIGLLLMTTSCGHSSTGTQLLQARTYSHGAHSSNATARIYSIDLSGSSFPQAPNTWALSGTYADFELVGSVGTYPNGYSFGHSDSSSPTIHMQGQPNTLKYSDVSAIPATDPMYNQINAQESNWLHRTINPGILCGSAFADRVIHMPRSTVLYKPNLAMGDVASAYQQHVIAAAKSNADHAIFYDGTATWKSDNYPPCNIANRLDWVHLDYANQLVGTFLDQEIRNGSIPIIVNENGDIDTTPQADITVRGMIGHQITGIKLEEAGQTQNNTSWQSFEDDQLVGAWEVEQGHGWNTLWEYGGGVTDQDQNFLQLRMQSIASVLLTYYPGAGVWWDFQTNSGFAVMPEVTIVPQNPLKPEPIPLNGGTGNPVATLAVGSGPGYGREYSDCYVGGIDEGICGVFVTTGAPSTWPWTQGKYNHTLVLTGSDLGDTWTMSPSGPPPPTATQTVPAWTGVIAFHLPSH